VPVVLSGSWFIIAAVITLGYGAFLAQSEDVSAGLAYLGGFIFAVLLAASVLAHELAHTAASQRLGIPVRRVTLFLLGGVSEATREPRTPAEEYLISVVGPLVSLVIGAAASAVLVLTSLSGVAEALLVQVALANTIVGLFNLLPGLPLDGGRLLRAGVWQLRGDRATASRAAGYAGKGVAVATLVLGMWWVALGGAAAIVNALIAGLLAAFIWTGADASMRAAEVDARRHLISVQGLVRPTLLVTADLPLAEAVRRAHETGARGIVVVDSYGRPTAVLRESKVTATPEQQRPWVTVMSVAAPIGPENTIADAADGAEIIEALRRNPQPEYVVVGRGNEVVGVLAAADVADVLRGSHR
jgi:Zn-dependent protease